MLTAVFNSKSFFHATLKMPFSNILGSHGLQEWIETSVYDAFPEELKSRVKNLTIPIVGQVFGWDDEWCQKTFVRDSDEQLPLMKERRNRVVYLDNDHECGWLRNPTKREISSADFAYVNT